MSTPLINSHFDQKTNLAAYSMLELVDLSRQGIPKQVVIQLSEALSISNPVMLAALHISERTWQRYTATKLLPQDVTERALQLTSLYQKGEEVFGQAEKFRNWMQYPNPVFDGKKPIDLLDSLYGFRAIEDELVRIDYGVLA
ncbi:type II RES/Xre toxin-antitoxin system antitoxin [Fibrella aquatica]|jgi:putative toxin-antitoxin system antitoxin component (TIGR02293 family)|uniref:type II RES/Xre toxin-antitoxin system antitoxin n=1 Tax=Fibrella aquatica TaxID=3242487 RepID=UPI003520D08D